MSSTWDQARIQGLIDDGVQESLTLEYKRAGSLDKQNDKRTEITKDVSAMANSAGGILIYGVAEYPRGQGKEHLPEKLDPVNVRDFTREWLEQVINTIRPKIDGILIHPVDLNTGADHMAYVVEIPQSNDAHQATDKKYYKRFNFESVPMEDYEIRDVMGRAKYPRIELEFEINVDAGEHESTNTHSYSYLPHIGREESRTVKYRYVQLVVVAKNVGNVLANYVSIVVHAPRALLFDYDVYPGSAKQPIDLNEIKSITLRNTTRDILETKFNPMGGSNHTYGPTRYVPVLPKLQFSDTIALDSDFDPSKYPDVLIDWQVHCDSAPVQSGKIALAEIPIKAVTRSRFSR